MDYKDDKNNLSEFMKKAYAEGRVKVYSEVKDADPELNEDYEFPGFYVGEQITPYPQYEIGDIVFIKKYKYKDGKNGTNHLFVIVDKDNHAVPIINFCMLISSNLEKLKFDSNYLIKRNDENNLKKDSIIKTDEIYKIKNEEISYKIGSINKIVALQYKDLFLESLVHHE